MRADITIAIEGLRASAYRFGDTEVRYLNQLIEHVEAVEQTNTRLCGLLRESRVKFRDYAYDGKIKLPVNLIRRIEQEDINYEKKHEIYCFNNGGSPGFLHAVALADDGHVLARHICSDVSFMQHDLGFAPSTWKHDVYNKHFEGDDWELVWVEDPAHDERVERALALNQEIWNRRKEQRA